MSAPRNTILQGDALAMLKTLPDECVQTVVTSPPYWGLRDYGVPGQIGLEPTLAEYVARMVDLFAEVRRVLRKDGTVWLNLGDSYASASACDRRNIIGNGSPDKNSKRPNRLHGGLKEKDLCGVPWRVAFALQDDGWWLRSDVIWSKPNPMPESVTDRPTRSHEYLFLLTKSERYYYDAAAIREPLQESSLERGFTYVGRPETSQKMLAAKPGEVRANATWRINGYIPTGRNKRSVWTVSSHPFPEAHFATFPPSLIEPCILAGSRPGDLVLDPFMGSGTTAIVAVKHLRDYLGCELNPDYIAMAYRRLSHVQTSFFSLMTEGVSA